MPPETPPFLTPRQRAAESLGALEKRDWELWSIALILLTVFAGGLVTFVYVSTQSQEAASPWIVRYLWIMLFGFIALVLLLNIYLIDKRRTLTQLRRRTLEQELELETQSAHALTDSLTQVYNRRFFDEIVPKEVRRSVRAQRALSLLLVDVDNFRQVNAELGHFVGDEVLRLVAETLKSGLRGSDYVFRFGGDEFLAVLPETDEAGTAVVVNRLQQAVAARAELQERVGRPVTVTIGPATFLAGRTLESVIEEAERKVEALRTATAESPVKSADSD